MENNQTTLARMRADNLFGILSFEGINELIDSEVITNVARGSVNAASLNVTLGENFLVERRNNNTVTGVHFAPIDFSLRQSPNLVEVKGSATLAPGAFALASIQERLALPADIACHVLLRSSAARIGLEHSLAGWGDPGYCGNLTLELTNVLKYHAIYLRGGDQVCQLIFHRIPPVPADRTYNATGGKYSGYDGPQGVKSELPR